MGDVLDIWSEGCWNETALRVRPEPRVVYRHDESSKKYRHKGFTERAACHRERQQIFLRELLEDEAVNINMKPHEFALVFQISPCLLFKVLTV